MAVIPQVVTEVSASGAQVIDGSLDLDGAQEQYLSRDPSTAGNQRTWTYAAWFERSDFSNEVILFGADEDNTNVHNWCVVRIEATPQMTFINNNSNSTGVTLKTSRYFRDSGWYHVVLAVDTTQSSETNRVKLYINGEQVKDFATSSYPAVNYQTQINSTNYHWVGREARGYYYRGKMSQVYLIDGQQLEPTEFGYTDPLTNTWRPKKFSGKYTGEFPLADYTGGLPILATNSLGTAVTSGTRADSNSANIVLAVPFNGNVTDYSATIKGSGSALVGSTDSITYPTTNDKYYGSSVYQNADGDVAWYITGESAFTIGTGAFTVECWVRNDGNHDGAGGANEDQYVWHFTDINMRLRMWKPSGGSRIITFYTGDITNEPTVATVLDNEWHHIAVVREGTGSNQFKIYVDGALSYTGTDGTNLSGDKFMVGNYSTSADYGFSGNIQDIRVYNAAKYTSAFTVPPDKNLAAGTNSFYLPFDGNTPIGKDQSGKGNNWTPVNFGGSNVIPKATGALPILNTVSGGKVAAPSVRGKVGIAVTVAGKTGGGNAYYLNGVEAPTLSYKRGQTVTFDTSDSTVSGHPFRFATAADAAGSTEYTTGISTSAAEGSAGAATTITIPTTAPETLYYYCTNHSGMGGSITGITTDIQVADPYASYCVLALPLFGVGTDDVEGSTDVSNQVNIKSTTTAITNTNVEFVTTQSNFYGGSGDFTGAATDVLSTGDEDAKFKMEEEDFTIECWVYSTSTSGTQNICQFIGDSSSKYYGIYYSSSALKFQMAGTGGGEANAGDVVFGTERWSHVAMVRNGSTLKGYVDGVEVASAGSITSDMDETGYQAYVGRHSASSNGFTGYIQDFRVYKGVAKYTENFIPASTNPNIFPDTSSGVAYGSELMKVTEGAVSFDGSGDYLSLAASTDFDLAGDFCIEAWVYRTTTDNFQTIIDTRSNTSTGWLLWVNDSGLVKLTLNTARTSEFLASDRYLTNNCWQHVAMVRSGSASNNCKMYINGTITAQGTNTTTWDGSAAAIGYSVTSGHSMSYWRGNISNLRLVNGSAVYKQNFTPPIDPLTNITNTKLLCCQSKTSATVAEVSPGTITANGDVAPTTFNPFDTDIDTVLGKSTVYATLNPLNVNDMGTTAVTISDGNLTVANARNNYFGTALSNLSMTSGKYYCEATVDSNDATTLLCGILKIDPLESRWNTDDEQIGYFANGYGYRSNNGNKENNSSNSSYGDSYGNGNNIGIALDLDVRTVTFYKEGVSQGVAYSGIATGQYAFGFSCSETNNKWKANFGQKPFKFPPPEGFQSLNLANLESPALVRPDTAVGIVTYTGTGAIQTINGFNFKPDMVWIKERSGTADHVIQDSVRGNYISYPNTNAVQGATGGGWVRKMLYNKVEIDANGPINTDTDTYVTWCFKAGGNAGTFNKDGVDAGSAAAAGVSGGSITPNACSVGNKQGFSILKYEGTGNANDTIATGLDTPVDFYIVKSLDNTGNWNVASKAMGLQYSLVLNDTADKGSPSTDYWNSTNPTDTLLSIGTADSVNGDGWNFILYAWANRAGLQKFGSYTGNGQATAGVYVDLGFRPALLITKKISSTSNWIMWDKERSPYNVANNYLYVNSGDGQSTDGTNGVDFLSNGFKMYNNYTDANNDDADYIYMAWADSPFHNLYGGEANAR